jgi:hypothetical protein
MIQALGKAKILEKSGQNMTRTQVEVIPLQYKQGVPLPTFYQHQ